MIARILAPCGLELLTAGAEGLGAVGGDCAANTRDDGDVKLLYLVLLKDDLERDIRVGIVIAEVILRVDRKSVV